ncbi:MAG: hypothetical protein FKY71_14440 [Spiribacter salinus]|uniref:Uncharacterized protein n=1 Tax=Spiribacter salinus TaxID=1335746 RepID=A0A540VNK1_9GAMM|nr:MAG: hypothetical protein FKY71_14440 [Spiribacter salinus]
MNKCAKLRECWLSRDSVTDDGPAAEVEEGFIQAAELGADGDLSGALHVCRMVAQDCAERLRS